MSKIRFLLGRYASVYTDYGACMYWGVDEEAHIPRLNYWRKRLARKGVDASLLKDLEMMCDYDPGDMGDVTLEEICAECDKVADMIAA